jgi:hypothetical protein
LHSAEKNYRETGNVLPIHALKTYRGSGGIALINVGSGRFNPGKGPRYTLNRTMGGTQSLDVMVESLLPLP